MNVSDPGLARENGVEVAPELVRVGRRPQALAGLGRGARSFEGGDPGRHADRPIHDAIKHRQPNERFGDDRPPTERSGRTICAYFLLTGEDERIPREIRHIPAEYPGEESSGQ